MKTFLFNYFMPIIATVLLIFSGSCQRDDICDATEITPRLIIQFINKDADRRDTLSKNVEALAVRLIVNEADINSEENRFLTPLTEVTRTPTGATEEETVSISNLNTSELTLPLNTTLDNLKFEFTKNFGDENESRVVSEILEFKYSRIENFVNRACGFHTTFENLEIDRGTSVWIDDIDILTTTITNEEDTHILLYH